MILLAVLSGLLYGLLAFAAGFILGTLRIIWLAPALGDFPAVAAELPIMLAVSFLLCRRLIGQGRIADTAPSRAAMGATGFLALMTLEMLLATLGFGQDALAFLRCLATPPSALGLTGQIAFGLLPLLVARR